MVAHKNYIQPAPAQARYHVEYVSSLGYVVVDPDGAVVQGSQAPFKAVAQAQAQELQRAADAKAKRGPRPCMCCGAIFQSSGIHNRLCDHCRRREDVLGEVARPVIGR